jgi:hypothetical protein
MIPHVLGHFVSALERLHGPLPRSLGDCQELHLVEARLVAAGWATEIHLRTAWGRAGIELNHPSDTFHASEMLVLALDGVVKRMKV